jgi:molecular chaperone Hsp33
VHNACRCSTEGIEAMLRRFSAEERTDMIGDNGRIGVTCEFCSTFREFDPKDFEG